jgi:hypothetical protein
MESGCHEWCSTIKRDGYGSFWHDSRSIQAHRAARIVFRGEVPSDRMVCHTCDNRRCVNLDHLYLGTASDNVRDKVNRFDGLWGRMKFGPETCADIRRLRAQGLSQQTIADRVGVDQTTVSRILRGATISSRKDLSPCATSERA